LAKQAITKSESKGRERLGEAFSAEELASVEHPDEYS
jgi:hypothetical protein